MGRRRFRTTMVVIAVALAMASAGRIRAYQRGELPARYDVVEKVVDGDTLHISIDGTHTKVRLIGIDTPETHGAGGLKECFGQEATDRMQRLAPPGTYVRVVLDEEPRDRYGRLLAYVYRVSDGRFLNLAQARDGYADVLSIEPNTAHAAELAAAVADAKADRRGLWGACGNADVPL